MTLVVAESRGPVKASPATGSQRRPLDLHGGGVELVSGLAVAVGIMTMSLIETVDLWKTYVMGAEEVHALRGVSIQHRARRVRRHHGAVGLGQVDADEPDRLSRHADARAPTC